VTPRFAGRFGLAALAAASPRSIKRRIASERELSHSRAAQASIFSARQAELDKQAAAVRKREVAKMIRENALAEAARIRARNAPHDQRTDGFPAGSGMSRELDDETTPQNAHFPCATANLIFPGQARTSSRADTTTHRTRRHRITGAGRSTAPAAARIDTGSSV
jgi:hypothetical protein